MHAIGNTPLIKLEGFGLGFVPSTFRTDLCDEVIAVSDAYETASRLTREEGIFGGTTSGAMFGLLYKVHVK